MEKIELNTVLESLLEEGADAATQLIDTWFASQISDLKCALDAKAAALAVAGQEPMGMEPMGDLGAMAPMGGDLSAPIGIAEPMAAPIDPVAALAPAPIPAPLPAPVGAPVGDLDAPAVEPAPVEPEADEPEVEEAASDIDPATEDAVEAIEADLEQLKKDFMELLAQANLPEPEVAADAEDEEKEDEDEKEEAEDEAGEEEAEDEEVDESADEGSKAATILKDLGLNTGADFYDYAMGYIADEFDNVHSWADEMGISVNDIEAFYGDDFPHITDDVMYGGWTPPGQAAEPVDEDFAALEEAYALKTVTDKLANKEGAQVGEAGKVPVQTKSPVVSKKADARVGGTPVVSKGGEAKGFAKETAPKVVDVKLNDGKPGNANREYKNSSKEGDASAVLNKSQGAGNTKSPVGSVKGTLK
jgi:hypothetical protein